MASDADRHAAQVAARKELADAGVSLPRSMYHSQRPLNTLLASAQRVTSRTLQRGWGKSEAWQQDAWDMFNLVGENRFLAVTLAQRMSQARFFVGKVAADPTEEPEPVEDQRFTDILNSIGSSASARSQLIARLGVNLFVAGDGWLVGIPKHLIPPSLLVGTLSEPVVDPGLLPQPDESGTMNIADLDWRMMSISEVSTSGGEVQLRLGATAAETIVTSPDALILIRVWRPHPHKWWEADSPVRSSLPVLRELVGLTMHVSAQIDSRLAGAGMLIVPQSAQRALQIAAGIEDDAGQDADQFTPALMEAMLKPISDRASASAIVPLIVTVPDEACDKFQFISFDKPLDLELRELRAETIRRLALGLDAPPELLLGTGSISHWGAWLVLEDVVKTHLEPPLGLICDAITTQYLWPVLVDQGMTTDEARQYVIWYDVSDLVVRPTRSADAQAMHAAGVISDAALRSANGFDDSDAPEDPATDHPVEVLMALDMVRANPALMSNPGLPQIVAQLRAVLAGDIPAVLDPSSVVRAAQEKTDNAIPPAGQTAPALPGAKAPDGGAKATPATGPTAGRSPGSTPGPTTPPAGGAPAGGIPAAKVSPPGSIAASVLATADLPEFSPTAEEIDELLAGGVDPGEVFGGPGSGRYPKGSSKNPSAGNGPGYKPPASGKPGTPGGGDANKDGLPDRIEPGFKPNPAQLQKMIAPLVKILDGLDGSIKGLGPMPKAGPVGDLKGDTVKSKVTELEKNITAVKAARTPAAKAAALQHVADARAELDVLSKRAITAAAAGHVSSQDDIAGKPHKAHPSETKKAPVAAPTGKPAIGVPTAKVPASVRASVLATADLVPTPRDLAEGWAH